MACRSMARAQEAVSDIVAETGIRSDQLPILQLDLNSLKSVRSFAAEFKQSKQISDNYLVALYEEKQMKKCTFECWLQMTL